MPLETVMASRYNASADTLTYLAVGIQYNVLGLFTCALAPLI
jgi:hypothetical protein